MILTGVELRMRLESFISMICAFALRANKRNSAMPEYNFMKCGIDCGEGKEFAKRRQRFLSIAISSWFFLNF